MNPVASNKTSRQFLKARNRSLILNTIDKHAPISRQDTARLTKIRPATVTGYIEDFIKGGFVTEIGPGRSTGGRRPILLQLNPQAGFAVGVYIVDTRIMAVIVNLKGELITQTSSKFSISKGKKAFMAAVLETIGEVIEKSELNKSKIIGIGLGIPGLVDNEKGISVFCVLYSWWADIHFKEIVEKNFAIPTLIENDTRVLTLGEKWFGKGKKTESFFYLDVSKGIAIGAFLNGSLYNGVGNSAGELGHTVIDKKGPLCNCGNHGCLEALASTAAIEKKMKQMRKQTTKPPVKFSAIVKAANTGDKTAITVLSQAGNYLGIAVANVVNLFNPGLIIIGGSIAQAEDLVLAPLKETFKSYALTKPSNEVDIHLTDLGESAGAMGATTLVLDKFFETF